MYLCVLLRFIKQCTVIFSLLVHIYVHVLVLRYELNSATRFGIYWHHQV